MVLLDTETLSIGHAPPSDPGSVATPVAPNANGESGAVGAPGDGCMLYGESAPTPVCVVRFFPQLKREFAAAMRLRPFSAARRKPEFHRRVC